MFEVSHGGWKAGENFVYCLALLSVHAQTRFVKLCVFGTLWFIGFEPRVTKTPRITKICFAKDGATKILSAFSVFSLRNPCNRCTSVRAIRNAEALPAFQVRQKCRKQSYQRKKRANVINIFNACSISQCAENCRTQTAHSKCKSKK